MSITHRSDAALLPGYHHSGDRGQGVLGASCLGTGPHGPSLPFNSLLPADLDDEVMATVLTVPPGLTFFDVDETGAVEAEGPEGVHLGQFRLWVAGVDRGTGEIRVVIGSPPVGSSGELSGSATVGPVAMAGSAVGVAPTAGLLSGDALVGPVTMQGSLSGYLSSPEPLSGPAYASAQAYIERFGLAEATGMLADEERLLTPQLLQDAVAGTFSGTPTAAQVAAGRAAAARLRRQLATVSNFMDGYLRSAVVLPMAAGDANAGTLEECCLHLTRFGLADDTDNATERMDTTAKMWRDWLRDVSQGKVQLVGVSGQAAPSQGRTRTGKTRSRWDWTGYGGGNGGGGAQ